MKLIDKLAQDHDIAVCMGEYRSCESLGPYGASFKAGFNKAIELLTSMHGDICDGAYVNIQKKLEKIGESEVE